MFPQKNDSKAYWTDFRSLQQLSTETLRSFQKRQLEMIKMNLRYRQLAYFIRENILSHFQTLRGELKTRLDASIPH